MKKVEYILKFSVAISILFFLMGMVAQIFFNVSIATRNQIIYPVSTISFFLVPITLYLYLIAIDFNNKDIVMLKWLNYISLGLSLATIIYLC